MAISGSEVVIQYPKTGGGGFVCRSVQGLPSTAPVQILFLPPDPASYSAAVELGQATERALRQLSPTPAINDPRCDGKKIPPRSCWVQANPLARKVLVLVGDGPTPVVVPTAWDTVVSRWPQDGAGGRILGVLAGTEDAAPWLPAPLRKQNISTWTHTVREAVGAVLVTAGIVTDDWRVFISYRRKEARKVADQLFDELTHRGFDVFLDRFRIPPRVDFESRLEDELRDKAMVVVLESPGILKSEWTRGELVFALSHRLGIFAVHLPGGAYVPLLGRRRIDVTGRMRCGRLTQDALQDAVEAIQREHERATTRRRRNTANAVHDALKYVGASPEPVRGDGVVRVPGVKPYRISPSPYPPGLREFHAAHLESSGDRAVLVGPAAFRERDRGERMRWLSARADIPLVDEAQLTQMAREIMNQTL